MKCYQVLVFLNLALFLNPVVAIEYFWQKNAEVIDGWYGTDWFGWVYPTEIPGWAIHSGIGNFYSTSEDPEAVWLWTPAMDWAFTGKSIYPHVYHMDGDDWLIHLKTSPSWWYSYESQAWTEIDTNIRRIEYDNTFLGAYGKALGYVDKMHKFANNWLAIG